MAAAMEVSLPQTILQKLLDLLNLESFHPHQEIAGSEGCRDLRTHIQHEGALLIGLFHATSSVLPSVKSYRNYWKPTQRGVKGYLSSLQWRVLVRLLWKCTYRVETNPLMCCSDLRSTLSFWGWIAHSFGICVSIISY